MYTIKITHESGMSMYWTHEGSVRAVSLDAASTVCVRLLADMAGSKWDCDIIPVEEYLLQVAA